MPRLFHRAGETDVIALEPDLVGEHHVAATANRKQRHKDAKVHAICIATMWAVLRGTKGEVNAV